MILGRGSDYTWEIWSENVPGVKIRVKLENYGSINEKNIQGYSVSYY